MSKRTGNTARRARAAAAIRKDAKVVRKLPAWKRAGVSGSREWDGLCSAGEHGLDYRGQPCDLCAKKRADKPNPYCKSCKGRGNTSVGGGNTDDDEMPCSFCWRKQPSLFAAMKGTQSTVLASATPPKPTFEVYSAKRMDRDIARIMRDGGKEMKNASRQNIIDHYVAMLANHWSAVNERNKAINEATRLTNKLTAQRETAARILDQLATHDALESHFVVTERDDDIGVSDPLVRLRKALRTLL